MSERGTLYISSFALHDDFVEPGRLGPTEYLPQNFLGVVPRIAEMSAGVERTSADLQQGLVRLDSDMIASSTIQNARDADWEDVGAYRHITRGAALAHLLLEESAPNFEARAKADYATLAGLDDPEPNPRYDTLKATLRQLKNSRYNALYCERRGETPEETAYIKWEFEQRVDAVLALGGLSGPFEAAVSKFTGADLKDKDATQLLGAKYGAALLILGVGVSESLASV